MIPGWLPASVIKDPVQLPLPEPFITRYIDEGVLGYPTEVLSQTFGAPVVRLRNSYHRAEVMVTYYNTHDLALVDRIE